MNGFWIVLLAFSLTACSSQMRESSQVGRSVLGVPRSVPLHETSGGGYANPEEARFFNLINSFRAELGVGRLAPDPRLNEAAKKHSEWMQGIDYLTHIGPTLLGSSYTRVVQEGVDSDAMIGENIARGNSSAQETFLQWLFSPGHLMGMIEPAYDHIGVSRSQCEDHQAWVCFWTTDFAQLNSRAESVREFTAEEVARAAEAVVGPLGERRGEISLKESFKPAASAEIGTDPDAPAASVIEELRSRLQRLRDRFITSE